MIVNASSLSALNVQVQKDFQAALQAVPPMLDKIASRIPSGTASNKYPIGWMTGTMREWLGDRQIQNLVAYVKTVNNLKYEQTIAVPKEDIEDDQVGWVTTAVQQMASEGVQHPWRLAVAELMTHGFDATRANFDGVCFFNASHTWAGSGYTDAQDNVTDEVLDEDAVYAGLQFFDEVRGPDGRVLAVEPDVFLAAADLRSTVEALFFQPLKANGESNPLYGKFAKDNVIIGHGIPSGRWAMLCTSKPVKPLVFQERRPFKMTALTNLTDENVFMRDEFLWGTDYRGAVATIAWWLSYGSTGDGS